MLEWPRFAGWFLGVLLAAVSFVGDVDYIKVVAENPRASWFLRSIAYILVDDVYSRLVFLVGACVLAWMVADVRARQVVAVRRAKAPGRTKFVQNIAEYYEVNEIPQRLKDEPFPNDGRMYVPATVFEILKTLDGRLAHEAEALAATKYYDKWLRVTVEVVDVTKWGDHWQLSAAIYKALPGLSTLTLKFKEEQATRLTSLHKGLLVDVVGRIVYGSNRHLILEDCEIVDVRRP